MASNPMFALGDGQGNLISGSNPLAATNTAITLVTYPPAAYTTANTGTSFDTTRINYLAVDTNVTAFTGGTTPTIQFFVDRLGADGVWYNIWSGQTTGSAAKNTFDLGPGFASAGPPNGTAHAVFTATARFGWAYTGAPTSVTFSASVIGR